MKTCFSITLLFVFFFSFGQQKDTIPAVNFQQQLNADYADPEKSPLTKEDLATFKSLNFFPINTDFIVEAKFVRTKKEKAFEMKTTTDRTPMYIKYGELHFTLQGMAYKLNVYQNMELLKKPGFKDYLFLPFSDLTSGNESYIGGRYIDFKIPKGKTAVIDFNQAYNPYCAYNPKYSCPIVPFENDLIVEIKAGVKKFHD